MKQKITGILLAVLLCLSAVLPVCAADGFVDEYYRANDSAGLLSYEEEQALNEKLDEISVRQKMDVTLITVDGLNGYSVSDYAEQVYEYCNFGYGSDKDGVLLLISMEDRDWYMATHGYGITVFTDAGIEYIGEQIKPDLSDGNYSEAFQTYADLCDSFITQAREGKPYDNGNLPRKSLSSVWIFVSAGIGILLALIMVASMNAQLKTVRLQPTANRYVKNGSLKLTESRDMYLYHVVTRTPKPKEERRSTGSSTHESSSGSSYGGGGGKF